MLFGKIKALVEYGVRTGLIEAEDMIYTRNRLLEALCEEDYADEEAEQSENLALLLDGLCDEAVKRGIIEDGATSRDLFDTKLMGLLTPRPSDVNRTFRALYKESPEKATDWFYKLCGDCNYIRRDRVARDLKWVYNDPRFGAIDITINLSKPEKDPKAIAAAKKMKASGYPACMLCKENIGYAGRMNHPHDEYHHIKKENIGLIEVMGLAVLPSRLKDELKTLKDVMLKNGDVSSVESIAKHAEWAAQVKRDHPEMNEANAEHILQQEVGKVFVKVLENAGVYKCTAEGRKAFRTFVESVR